MRQMLSQKSYYHSLLTTKFLIVVIQRIHVKMIHVRTMVIVFNWWVSIPTAVIVMVQDTLDLTAIKVSNIIISSWLPQSARNVGEFC